MSEVKSIISEIVSKKEIKNLSFAGCGGSLTCFYAPSYYIQREANNISTCAINAHEFTVDTPKFINENSIVVCASRRGDTAQTVEAAKKAKECGATVIGLQYTTDTPLEKVCDYTIQFNDGPGIPNSAGKSALALEIAYEVLHQVEGTGRYEEMVAAMNKLDEILPEAVVKCVPDAINFSIDYKDDDIIYTMGSGTAWSAAHQEAICIFMEMQWINSSVIQSDEFFNGPFEITNPDTAYLVFKSTGKTREEDERALAFLERHNHHYHVLDGYDYGLEALGDVSGYFDAMFLSGIIGVYNHLLADMRDHPLSKRKYMWKYNY